MKLTREEIDTMQAGRQMDALIAEKVMGWHVIPEEHKSWLRMAWTQLSGPHHADAVETMIVIPHDDGRWHYGQPSWFSTDDRTALEVLCLFNQWEIKRNYNDYTVVLNPYHLSGGRAQSMGEAKTLALAICRAALRARLTEVKNDD